jgi:hypothetical protein
LFKDKEKALELLKEKSDGVRDITYKEIEQQTNYSKRQLIRLNKEIGKKDITSILTHGNFSKVPYNKAIDTELSYIKNFKKKYPSITISQFQDIYTEDVIWKKADDVVKYNLKVRSYSFFEVLYHQENWLIPRKHKAFNKNSEIHALRDPALRRGILIIIDGTPHDWFENGLKQSLHLAIDDATGEYLAGWFMPTETLEGYCHLLKIILIKYGVPVKLDSDKHSIFKSPTDKNLTTFGLICNELGIEMIFANTPQAKGKVEKANDTIQQRLLNDIKRFNINSVEQLNIWFNDFYSSYLNTKFAYKPKENKSEFIPLTKSFINNKLNDLFVVKNKRKILNGNSISYNNNYYVPIDSNNKPIPIYKGSSVEVWENIFDHTIKIYKNKKAYNTIQAKGHIQNQELRQLKINNQKELDNALDAVYSSSEERIKAVQTIIDKNALEEKRIKAIIDRRNILRNAGKNSKRMSHLKG